MDLKQVLGSLAQSEMATEKVGGKSPYFGHNLAPRTNSK